MLLRAGVTIVHCKALRELSKQSMPSFYAILMTGVQITEGFIVLLLLLMLVPMVVRMQLPLPPVWVGRCSV